MIKHDRPFIKKNQTSLIQHILISLFYIKFEQGTLLAKKCRVLKSNDTYHFQKPRINKTQWYMIYSYNFSVSMIHFTLNTAPF